MFIAVFELLPIFISGGFFSVRFDTFLQIHSCEAVNEVKVYVST